MAEPDFNIIWPTEWVYQCSVGHLLYIKQDPLCDAKLCGLLWSSSSSLLKVAIGSGSLMQIVAAENPSLSQVQSLKKPVAIFVASCKEEPQGVLLKIWETLRFRCGARFCVNPALVKKWNNAV